jgi:thiosulfate/3-mercaptopyruvate sulfurtransferase
MKIDVDELLRNGDKYQVVDARSHAEWIGTDSHGNPRTGRIPGAVHLDWSSLVSPGPAESFREETELAAIVAAANLDRKAPTVTYCQAGVRGSYLAFVLTLLGFEDVRVFDGSIREWASRSDTPMSAGS